MCLCLCVCQVCHDIHPLLKQLVADFGHRGLTVIAGFERAQHRHTCTAVCYAPPRRMHGFMSACNRAHLAPHSRSALEHLRRLGAEMGAAGRGRERVGQCHHDVLISSVSSVHSLYLCLPGEGLSRAGGASLPFLTGAVASRSQCIASISLSMTSTQISMFS